MQTSRVLLETANKILHSVLKKSKVLKQKVDEALIQARYPVRNTGNSKVQTYLLAFYGATGGYGIILAGSLNGPQLLVMCPFPKQDEMKYPAFDVAAGKV